MLQELPLSTAATAVTTLSHDVILTADDLEGRVDLSSATLDTDLHVRYSVLRSVP